MKLNLKKFRVSQISWNRRVFDPTSIEDMGEYKYFLQQQKWKNTCPFILEWPFTDMLQMIEHKIVRQHINSLIKITSKKK